MLSLLLESWAYRLYSTNSNNTSNRSNISNNSDTSNTGNYSGQGWTGCNVEGSLSAKLHWARLWGPMKNEHFMA